MRAAAFFQHQETLGTNGGTATSGSWEDRKITNIISDLNSIISLNAATGVITIIVGTYYFDIRTPFLIVDGCQSRLVDASSGAVLLLGSNAQTTSTTSVQVDSHIKGLVTFSAITQIKVQSRVATTKATNGYGISLGYGTEVYTTGSISVLG